MMTRVSFAQLASYATKGIRSIIESARLESAPRSAFIDLGILRMRSV